MVVYSEAKDLGNEELSHCPKERDRWRAKRAQAWYNKAKGKGIEPEWASSVLHLHTDPQGNILS